MGATRTPRRGCRLHRHQAEPDGPTEAAVDKLNAQMQENADKERQICASLPTEAGRQGQRTILDRMSDREQFLQARLQALQQTRPALEALQFANAGAEDDYRPLVPALRHAVLARERSIPVLLCARHRFAGILWGKSGSRPPLSAILGRTA